MSDELPPVRCDDPSTWQHKDEKIDLPRLLELIEKNGGPRGLDLHGCDMAHIDARLEALRPHVEAYAQQHGADAKPPWLAPRAEGGIDLYGAHLEHANLSAAHLEHADLLDAHLENAYLWGDAHLEHAILHRAHLEKAVLQSAHLEHAFLLAAHLQHANLDSAHLQNTTLQAAHLEHAFLTDAHLEDASLVDAHLEHGDLRRVHLERADLRGAHLEHANFADSRLCGAFWYGSYLDRTRIRRGSLGQAIGDELGAKGRAARACDFPDAREAYMALKTNFDSIGRYEDASWAYVKEQQMEKAMHFPTTRGHGWVSAELRRGGRRWRKKDPGRLRRLIRASILSRARWAWLHLRIFFNRCPPDIKAKGGQEHLDRPRWLRNWAYELLTGYGERPWNPVIIAAASMAAFAVSYWATAAVRGFWDAVAYSIATFATFNLARPATQPQGLGVEIASAVQAMLGIGLFALFVFTLGNRMRRS